MGDALVNSVINNKWFQGPLCKQGKGMILTKFNVRKIIHTFVLVLVTVFLWPTIATAQYWQAQESRNPQGLHALSLTVQKHEFTFEITCD